MLIIGEDRNNEHLTFPINLEDSKLTALVIGIVLVAAAAAPVATPAAATGALAAFSVSFSLDSSFICSRILDFAFVFSLFFSLLFLSFVGFFDSFIFFDRCSPEIDADIEVCIIEDVNSNSVDVG